MELYYHLSVIGTPPENQVLLNRMDRCLDELLGELEKISTDDVRYTPRMLDIDSTLSPRWEQLLHKHKIKTMKIPTPLELSADGQPIPGDNKRNLVQMSDLSDLVLGFWNEDPDSDEMPVWEALHRSMEKHVPCIWISTRDGSVYWALDILFEPFQQELLSRRIEFLQGLEKEDAPDFKNNLNEKFMLFENKRLNRMLTRLQKGLPSIPQVEDEMLDARFALADANAKKAHRVLLDQYSKHDTWAMQLSNLYRGSIRFRMWLPLVSTVTLAFGFYLNSVIGGIFNFFVEDKVRSQAISDLFFKLGAIFMLANLVLYIASHAISHNKKVQGWHAEFLHHRLIAEVMRFYLHVVPYGISLPLDRILQNSGFSLTEKHREYVEIWRTLHQATLHIPPYREENTDAFLNQLINYIDSQIQYHKKSANRYAKITKTWKRRSKIALGFGVFFLLVRGALPLFVILKNADSLWVSVANMGAMVVPAIATYIAGKLSLSGYEESYAMDISMIERLNQAKKLTESMKNRAVNYSMVRNLIEKLEVLLLDDVTSWTKEMEKCKVKGL